MISPVELRSFLHWLEGPGNKVILLHHDLAAAKAHLRETSKVLLAANRTFSCDPNANEITWENPARAGIRRIQARKNMTAIFMVATPENLRNCYCDRLWVSADVAQSPAYQVGLLLLNPAGDYREALRIEGRHGR